MKTTKSAGGVVMNAKGQVVVVNQNGDSWSLPKGHVEKGETSEEAARREIHEEAGIRDLKLIADLGSYERYRLGRDGKDDTRELKKMRIFYYTTKRIRLKPLDKKMAMALWVDKEKVAELLTHPRDKKFFRSILQFLKS